MPWWCLSRPTYLDDRSTGVCVPLWAFPAQDLGHLAFFFFFRCTAQRSVRNQPGRCGAQMLLAQGEKELILVALLDENDGYELQF